ncbi:MAG: transcriptional repressor [Synergistaceae bacterium]|jgi:Fur family ferric uptake transcriptional regulator|nr:transcriptional repressor [Synergistaceae bacterium]
MGRPVRYNTAQSKAVLEYLASLGSEHVTAAQIAEHFGGSRRSVGLTTVYRHLDRLVESGHVRKYFVDGDSSACYQYAADDEGCSEHFHLKCEGCGALLHLECGMLDEIPHHVYEEHSFLINRSKIVFYGKCADCMKSADTGIVDSRQR